MHWPFSGGDKRAFFHFVEFTTSTHFCVQIGKPIPVKQMPVDKITDKDIDALHNTFVKEMERLFERTKAKHGVDAKTKLQIL